MSKNNNYKLIWIFLLAALCVCAFIAKVRLFIIGFDIDEQYAVSLAYRLAKGDMPVLEMWEPHQTSAFLPGIFLKIYMGITGSADYAVIALRIFGALIQGLVAYGWYRCFSKDYDKYYVALSALLIFSALPKWIQTPEFANQQIWWMFALIASLSKALKKDGFWWGVLAGIFMCLEVISYPGAVIVCVAVLVLMAVYRKFRTLAGMIACPAVIGGTVSVSLLAKIGWAEMSECVSMILADPSHKESLTQKLLGYFKDFEILAVYMLVTGVSIALIWFAVRRLSAKKLSAQILCLIALTAAMVWQYIQWFVLERTNTYASYFWLAAMISAFILVEHNRLFALTLTVSISGIISVLLMTNLDLYACLIHLIPMTALLLMTGFDSSSSRAANAGDQLTTGGTAVKEVQTPTGGIAVKEAQMPKGGIAVSRTITALWVLLIILSYVCLVRVTEGWHNDVFMVKQKVLAGPAKGIYCEYVNGTYFNMLNDAVSPYINEKDNVLYIGMNSLAPAVWNAGCSNASTISTPYFDERYLEYFEINPAKRPSVVLLDKDYMARHGADVPIIADVYEMYPEIVYENDDVMVRRR